MSPIRLTPSVFPSNGQSGKSIVDERFDAADRLGNSLLIFNQGKPNMVVAALAETDTRRNRDTRPGDHLPGKFKRTHFRKLSGDLRPDEHRALW